MRRPISPMEEVPGRAAGNQGNGKETDIPVGEPHGERRNRVFTTLRGDGKSLNPCSPARFPIEGMEDARAHDCVRVHVLARVGGGGAGPGWWAGRGAAPLHLHLPNSIPKVRDPIQTQQCTPDRCATHCNWEKQRRTRPDVSPAGSPLGCRQNVYEVGLHRCSP
eukprot:gene17672-biopygen14423